MEKKNILIIDDSALMRRMISDIISTDERFVVCDTASNGLEAYDKITLNPSFYDIVILDINVPKMDGIQFMEEINRLKLKLTVIVVSTIAVEGAAETIRLLELGAFDFVKKPSSFSEAKGESFQHKLLSHLSYAAGFQKGEAKPVLRESTAEPKTALNESTPVITPLVGQVLKRTHKTVSKNATKLVALACSTGGPKALQQVIPLLPKNMDAPMLIVQHMPAGFTKSLAGRLNELSEVTVKEAENGDILEKGTVYLAKGGSHMRIKKDGCAYRIVLTDEPPRGGLRPCADIMYESLMDSDFGDITCVVLTGMGGDGTAGIKQLCGNHNIYVIGQDAETSTVYGMPKVLFEAGLTDEVVPLGKIADAIIKNVGVR